MDPVQNQVQPCLYPLLLLDWVSACQHIPVLPTCCELEAATAEYRAFMYLILKEGAVASESRHHIPVIFLAWEWWEQVLSGSGSKMVSAGISLSVFFCCLAAGTLGSEVPKEGTMSLQQGGQDQHQVSSHW